MHFMIDIETFGVGLDAAVFEIACVGFDEGLDPNTWPSLHLYVIPEGECDPDTILWWLRQERILPQPVEFISYKAALSRLATFIMGKPRPRKFWSHGVFFDLAILTRAYRSYTMELPWDHRSLYDTRTLELLCEARGIDTTKPPNSNKHCALSDARCQAQWVSGMLKEHHARP